ncbi:hypothetical protein LTR37_007146 [Vermiconidia calcicola]|uniref:Uncharacterized protein n=1 Tax=Vermiconidia calcicola TaxID=1690605 RepID=A0ACC3NEN3_9PEZI|nr:hypothetical protein LTR37_007146 [Vermiconidia calcicola]
MNLCTLTVVPYTFILLEARFGSSSLQNYEALLTSQVLSPGAKLIWRLALGFFIVLPLGLSVAYKRFLGGTSSAQITVDPPGQYGIDFPDISTWAPSGDAIYLLATSISPFLSASQYNPQPYPAVDAFPSPYGYNTLLLSGNAAALLDIPTKSYVKRAQASLSNTAGEEWYLNSTVDAYVAMQAIGSDFQSNDRTWFKAVNSSVNLWPAQGLSGAYLWEKPGVSIGFMPSEQLSRCFIGVYENSEVQEGFLTFSNPRYSEYASFRPYAQEFSISRRRCSGQWKLNSTNIVLLGGDCDLETPVNSSVLQGPFMVPDPYALLPELHYVFTGFAPSGDHKSIGTEWLNATYAVATVTALWARALYMQERTELSLADYGGLYPAVHESIISVRPTLKAMPLLYMVLAVHPAITLLALLVAARLYHVPVGRGFGVVSILSGLEQSSLQIIRGAGLSGRLASQVRLQVKAEVSEFKREAKVSYRLAGTNSRMADRTQLQNNREYA